MTADRGRAYWDIADVLARTDLARLLDEVTVPAAYSTRGRRWHCPMPDHEDRHPSVTMHTDARGHQRWRCWSGDDTHRGDAIDLVMATQRQNRVDAIAWLARRAGLRPSEPTRIHPLRPAPTSAVLALDPAVVAYVEACTRVLRSPGGREVRAWLHHRGFDDEILRVNHVGADPGRARMRRTRGLPAGSSPAATFPALTHGGDIRYVQARYLHPSHGRKYDNPAAALGTNPRIAWLRTTATAASSGLVVCEGIPDALTAAQAGFRAVAILGSQLPDERVATELARAVTDTEATVCVVPDGDHAGRAFAQRLHTLLAAHRQRVEFVEPPPGLDLNAWSLTSTDWRRQLTARLGRDPLSPTSGHEFGPVYGRDAGLGR